MKLSSRVVWSEGMYLGPHHFQAQNRYFEDSSHFAFSGLWRDAWGLIGCELDSDSLANGTLSLRHAEGIFPDGLPFSIPECDVTPGPRIISEAFPMTRDSVIVLLAIAPLRAGKANVEFAPANGSSNSRYTSVTQSLCDETTGSDEKPVALGRKNMRLVFETELPDEAVALPLARIVRDGVGHFSFDPHFIPPSLRISASECLMSLLRRLVETLEEKGAAIRTMRQSQGKYQAGWSAGEVAAFWFLHSIHSALGPLRHLTFSKHGHPEEVFRELSRLGGALCTFGLNSDPRSLPLYDHDHLDECFAALDQHIRSHLEIVVPTNAIHIPLSPVRQYFWEADVSDQRCFGPSRWILGMQASTGEAAVIARTPALVKVCSAKFVPELVKRALPGLTLTHLPVPPAAVAPQVEMQYFSASKDGPCWEHLLHTRRIGVYAPGELPNAKPELIVVLES
jgi:type VI secretion system protein ImpJ